MPARLVDPYPPSWFDRFTVGVERLPGPAALWYGVLAGGVGLLFIAIKWVDGAYPVGHFNIYHLVFICTPIYILAVLHGLDRMAGQALDEFRPVLAADAATMARLRYDLTTLPATPTLLVTLVSAVGLFSIWSVLGVERLVTLRPGPMVLLTLLEVLLSLSTWALTGLYVYHTIHQLRVVTTIYAQYTRISLFTLGPLYAFSRLTALTAIAPHGIFLADYLGWSVPGGAPITTGTLGLWLVFGLLSIATFVLPLLGVHQLLAQEKAQAQLALAGRVQILLDAIHRQVESHMPSADATGATKNLLDSLLAEQGLLTKVSTWPWAPETPRAVASALLLPVVVLVLNEVVKRLFGF